MKKVIVTGAAGTIGSEICRQLIQHNVKKVIAIDKSEIGIYHQHKKTLNDKISYQLIDINDYSFLEKTIKENNVQIIFHAAAYKHVPIVEHNLAEGLKNNVFGSLTIAQASLDNGISDFVFISTDKAVRPTNAMGATKRLSEICLQALFSSKKKSQLTKFSMVRFGNVLDSSGSVIPKFRKQINDRLPLTVTHPEITRFFMTIEEAAELVIQAGAMARGGEVFLLEMGEPIKILDLAKKMIQLSGLKLKDESNPNGCLLYTSPSPRDKRQSRMPSSA